MIDDRIKIDEQGNKIQLSVLRRSDLMEYKQIFKKSDGKPVLIKREYDESFEFDKDKFIDDIPPSVLYEPIHYDEKEQKWVGTSYEVYKENLDKEIKEEHEREGIYDE